MIKSGKKKFNFAIFSKQCVAFKTIIEFSVRVCNCCEFTVDLRDRVVTVYSSVDIVNIVIKGNL